jgi:hypothetical protein
MKKLLLVLSLVFVTVGLIGCESSADRVSDNLSKQAEEFRILRNIKVTNGITDSLIFEGIGFCSVETAGSSAAGMMELTCKTGMDSFTKDYFYMSDNVVISVVQLEGYDVPQYHKQFVFAAQALIPMVEFVGDNVGE